VNRLTGIAEELIRPSQTAFMPRKNIMEGVVILHETIHELHRKKMNGVILKLDFEKAYDKVKWPFLQQTLRVKGFSEKWCLWINEFVNKGSVGIKVNNKVGRFFQTKKGLRQGDPLSPLLFNLVADMLATLIARAQEEGQINALVPHLVEGGLSILQYADDTILFMDHDFWTGKKYETSFMCFWTIIWSQNQFSQKWSFLLWRSKELGGPIHTTIWLWDGPIPFQVLRDSNAPQKKSATLIGKW
jgi:hypothetical protein